jgi:hypothetical protein
MVDHLPSHLQEESRPSGLNATGRVFLIGDFRRTGEGLTQRIESLLKRAPLRRFTMREIYRIAGDNGTLLGEVSSVLHKLEFRKNCVTRHRGHNGTRIVDTWTWRI